MKKILLLFTFLIAFQINCFPIDVTVGGGGTENSPSYQRPVSYISTDNSFSTLLGSNETVTGNWESIDNTAMIYIVVTSDQDSQTDGVVVQFSPDQSTIINQDLHTLVAGSESWSFQAPTKYFRVIYHNGSTIQTSFSLSTKISSVYGKASSHRVSDGINNQDDAEATISVITGQSEVDGTFENIKTYKDALQVDEALVHEVAVNKHFYRESGASTTLAEAVTAGAVTINVNSAVGITAGDEIILRNSTHESVHHIDVIGVSGTVVTLNRPVDASYIIGDSVIEIDYALHDAAGTLTNPISYKIEPLPGERFQITRLLITMLDDSAMDLSTFGGISALTNGVVVRGFVDGEYRTYTHWQANSDLSDDMYDVTFPDKAPAGSFSLAGRWTFTNGQFVVDLDGDNNDWIEILIQDDLTALSDFSVKAQGRIFGE